jgi:N-acetylmuramoyl-L-alanine amidase
MVYFIMKQRRPLSVIWISIALCVSTLWVPPALCGAFDLRLLLGDAVQESRTTAVNWPKALSHPNARKAAPVAEAVVPIESKRFRVLVDVGHGGHDDGAPGPNGILEKHICLKIASEVRSRLERVSRLSDFPIDVKLSRENDAFLSLKDRVKDANTWGADLFVSIHANSSPVPRARGFEVYFLANEATDAEATRLARLENGDAGVRSLSHGVRSILSDLTTNAHILESSRFAETVYSALAERLRPNGRGVRQAPFAVLSGTQMPALLIEVGYLTNQEEASALARSSYQNRIAGSIAEGVLDFALRTRKLSRADFISLARKRTI